MSQADPAPAPPPYARPLTLIADAAALIAAIWQFVVVLGAMRARYDFPWDLEWMEGGTLISALRVLQGQPIHGAPALEYVPFIYPPLYAWVVGALGHVLPFGYALARGTSIAAFLAACAALIFGAREAGARWSLAVACAALFAGTWEDGGTFYDLVRVDSLTVALLGWSLVLGAPAPAAPLTGPALAPWRPVASGLLLAAAFASKHNAAIFGLPLLLSLAAAQGRAAAARFAAASILPALAFLAHQEYATGGRFLDWIVGVPGAHGIKADRLITGASLFDENGTFTGNFTAHGAQLEMWEVLPLTTTLALAFPGWLRSQKSYWLGVTLVGVVICSLMRGHIGGFINVLIPMYWIVSLWPALLAGHLAAPSPDAAALPSPLAPPPRLRAARIALSSLALIGALALLASNRTPLQSKFLTGAVAAALPGLALIPGAAPAAATLAPAALSLAATAQLYLGAPAPARYLPSERDRAAIDAFLAELREIPDPILSPYAPYALVQAGKDPTFSLICLWDIDYKDGPFHPFAARVERSLADHRWSAILTPNDKLGYGLLKHYRRDRNLKHLPPDTVVGWEVQLRQVWVPAGDNPQPTETPAPAPAAP